MENFAPLTAATWRPEAWQASAPVPGESPSGQNFQSLLEQFHPAPAATSASANPAAPAARAPVPTPAYTVRGGDSLNSIVQQLAREQGVQLSAEQTHRYALELAQSNRISDPNRIRPGQSLQTAGLFNNLPSVHVGSTLASTELPAAKTSSAPVQTQQWLAQRPVAGNRTPSPFSAPHLHRAIPHARALPGNAAAHPVL
ncbi:MAG: LysM peptidoglycan-binding domain-containing protein, partial [Limnohabitans sp.]